jgi:pimeloyl-ACP methyl ester carboxylesterase
MATYETAPDQYITVNNIRYAYRLFGNQSSGKIPLFLHIHFRGNMDWWDPTFINPLAAKRPILLIDQTGVGRSEGTVRTRFLDWAYDIIDVVRALGIKKIDCFGFSMGGFVSPLITLEAPDLVRKLIVAGSGISNGEGVVPGAPEYFEELASGQTDEEIHKGMIHTFFSSSARGHKEGDEWWQRMTNARPNRAPLLESEGIQNQIASVQRWLGPDHREEGSYDRLHEIKVPVLIANGSNDLLVPTENSIVLWRKLRDTTDAHLHLYPDSGHGFLDEYAEHFSGLVNDFLDEEH